MNRKSKWVNAARCKRYFEPLRSEASLWGGVRVSDNEDEINNGAEGAGELTERQRELENGKS
jgi:hypothetical protein